MKYLLPLLLLFCSFSSYAYRDYVCYPTDGTPVVQNFDTGDVTISSAQNTAGAKLINLKALDTGTANNFTCEFPNTTATCSHFWTAQALYGPVVKEGQYQWMPLTPNLSASVEIYIYRSSGGRSSYHSVPFTNVSNNTSEKCKLSGTAASGSKGTISVKITKPAVGHIGFNGTVAKIWHYRSTLSVQAGDPVEVMVNLNLSIDVPDNCTLRPGGVLNINLGTNIKQNQFTGQAYPQPPKSYTPKPVNLVFDCTIANAALDVTLVGNKDEQGQGYATSNPDVSVIVTSSDGTILPPNTEAGMVNVKGDKTTDTLKLLAYPTNSSENTAPLADTFQTTATILLNYE